MSRFNSIQTRLVITVIALITAIVASFAFFSYREIQASLIERFQNEASVIVSPFYTAIGEELPDDADLSLFARVAIISRVSTFFPELVRTFPDVQGILYANPQGEILRSDGVESIVPPALLSSITNGQKETLIDTDGTIIISVPFNLNDQNLGSSVLFFSSANVEQQQQTILRTALAILIPFILFGAVGALLIGRNIAHPIVKLADSIAEGTLSDSELNTSRKDEIGTLARSFTEMRDAINMQIFQLNNEIQERKRAEAKLDAYRQDLEIIVEKRTRDLKIASAVSRQLTTVLNLEELLPQLVEETKTAFNLDYVSIFLYNVETRYLKLAAGSGDTGDTGSKMMAKQQSFHIEARPSLIAKAARDQHPITINDTYQNKDFVANPYLPDIRAEAVLPMTIGNTLIGVMGLQSNTVDRFQADDLEIFTTLAEQISIALRNAQLYETQIQLAKDLRHSDQLKTQFLASMSHELRTPLNAIMNFTEMTMMGMMGPVNDDQKDLLNQSLDSSKHLLNLINDVLDISKIQAGKLTLFVENDVNLYDEIDTAMGMVQPLLNNEAVQLVQEIDDNLPLIRGDKRRIRQIILNLLTNAAKFTDDGSITLSAKYQDDQIFLTVIDTGIGISEDMKTLVFQPFTQTSDGIKHAEGTGLGLPITKNLVEAHNGQIWLESEPGKGCAFYVSLPVAVVEII